MPVDDSFTQEQGARSVRRPLERENKKVYLMRYNSLLFLYIMDVILIVPLCTMNGGDLWHLVTHNYVMKMKQPEVHNHPTSVNIVDTRTSPTVKFLFRERRINTPL